MTWRGCRRAAGLYLVLFLLIVVCAPHHHVNDLEDLLLDQRSDSGLVIVTGSVEDDGGESFHPYRVARDVPCPACFMGDFVSVATSASFLASVIAALSFQPAASEPAPPERLGIRSSSRAPPRGC